MKRRGFGFYLRLIISLLLIYFLLDKVEWVKVREVLGQTDLFFLVLSVIVAPLLVYISAIKWYMLCRPLNMQVSVWTLFLLYLVGGFFNHFLPSNVGGDVVRGYQLGKYVDRKAEAMASVFVERFTGFTALIFLGLVAVGLKMSLLEDVKLTAPLGIIFIGYVVGSWVIFVDSTQYLDRLSSLKIAQKFLAMVKKFQTAIFIYANHKESLFYAMLNSFLFYLGALINVYVSALAFGVDIPFVDLMVIVPLVLLIAMFPISLGGVGLQEWAYVFIFAKMGIPGAVGLSVGILMRAKGLLLGLVGGVIYALMNKEQTLAPEIFQSQERQ